MDNHICPVCGESEISKSQNEEIVKEPFGGQKEIRLTEYTCETCGSTGDFFNENESLMQDCLSVLKSDAVTNILNDFSANKISLSSMERALELPQRTLTKWKNKASKPSSTGVALLKFLRVFPWLLDVAENKYDYSTAQKIHMTIAFKEMLKHMSFNENIYRDAEMGTTVNSHFLFVRVEKPITEIVSENKMHQAPSIPEVRVSYK